MPELDPTKRRLTWTVYATPLTTLTTDLGLSIRVLGMLTGDGDFFRARGITTRHQPEPIQIF